MMSGFPHWSYSPQRDTLPVILLEIACVFVTLVVFWTLAVLSYPFRAAGRHLWIYLHGRSRL